MTFKNNPLANLIKNNTLELFIICSKEFHFRNYIMLWFTISYRKVYSHLLIIAFSASCAFSMESPDSTFSLEQTKSDCSDLGNEKPGAGRDHLEFDDSESFQDWCDKQINFDLNHFPDPFDWFPFPMTYPAMRSPEIFAQWWQNTYSETIIAFESWKGYSSYLTALSLEQKKSKCLESSPPISQFLDIFFGLIDEEILEGWQKILKKKNLITFEDFSKQMATDKDLEGLGIPPYVLQDLKKTIDELNKIKDSLAPELPKFS